MTPAEYTAVIARLGMTGAQAAELFGYTRQIHYSQWTKKGPPESVAWLLRIMDRLGYTPDELKRLAS